MKQTAVEWLVEDLGVYLPISITSVQLSINQAKEMEKQQQDEQWDDGFDHGYCSRDHDDNDEFLDN